jgi:hypothetical protein
VYTARSIEKCPDMPAANVDATHPDLAATRWTNPNDPPNGENDDENAEEACMQRGFTDDVWGWDFNSETNQPLPGGRHGTAVAGMACAVTGNGEGIAAVAGGADGNRPIRWVSLLVATTLQQRDAIDYARCKGIKILNMSFTASLVLGSVTGSRPASFEIDTDGFGASIGGRLTLWE